MTFVSNHDTQPLQSLESVLAPWFVPLAYALILLRRGGYPCIFAADYFGAAYRGIGWTRSGDEAHPGWMAVLLSNEGVRTKAMQTGAPDITYTDLTRHIAEPVTTNGDGWGDFRCRDRSVWLPQVRRKRTPRKSAHALEE